MGLVQHIRVVLWGVLLLGAAPEAAGGQVASVSTEVARFQEARAMAVDPTGRLYVADAGRDVVRLFDSSGAEVAVLGGSGIRAGEFDGPSGLDPTNGQTLLVADAGNGRVQRFSAELQYLEAVPVGASFGTPEQRVFDDGRDGGDVQGDGRPIAVVSTDGDETYVIDARAASVLTFDAQRRPERVIAPSSRLRRPVALALGTDRRLYVADADRAAVYAYDRFGSYLRTLPLPELSAPRALTVVEGRLWVVCADRIVVWAPEAETVRARPVALDAPLVDAARWEGTLYLLTERRLVRRPGWW
jgi:DNA-binding beta-propeller fold protein YncE